jgi:hypothetical protein
LNSEDLSIYGPHIENWVKVNKVVADLTSLILTAHTSRQKVETFLLPAFDRGYAPIRGLGDTLYRSVVKCSEDIAQFFGDVEYMDLVDEARAAAEKKEK